MLGRWILAAFAFSLLGCGGGAPAVYVVALDTRPITLLPGSCFISGTAPTDTKANGIFESQQWTHWKGAKEEFLEIPSLERPALKLGDAGWVTVSGLIGGTGELFGGQKDLRDDQGDAHISRRHSLLFTVKSIGDTLEGTLDLAVENSCSGSTCPDLVNCSVTLDVTGRKVPDERVQYSP